MYLDIDAALREGLIAVRVSVVAAPMCGGRNVPWRQRSGIQFRFSLVRIQSMATARLWSVNVNLVEHKVLSCPQKRPNSPNAENGP